MGVYIWSIIMQVDFNRQNPGHIDWDEPLYARSFLPYFFVQTTGPLSQSYMYWLMSSFATDAQGECRTALKMSNLKMAATDTHASQRPQRCRLPLPRGRGPGHLVRHEHPDPDQPSDRLVRASHPRCSKLKDC